ncbi:hypothetical protein LDENG_00191170 [Lucifuga dentata]|nr:hypothetical protein LDENG_00191170 [Lucifuga dentata]
MGQLDFPSPYWENVSDNAKALIAAMLQVKVDQRFTAAQVLDHAWLKDDHVSDNEHQLPVAGKIKKHFNMGPKPHSSTAGVSVITTTPLDKEKQVFRRRRHQDVKPAARVPNTASHRVNPGLTPAEFISKSEDVSPSSGDTVRSPTSPF